MNKFFTFLIEKSDLAKKLFSTIFPSNYNIKRIIYRKKQLYNYINSFYSQESLSNKKFFNIGAGNQRSNYKFWSYIDLESSKYSKKDVDIFFDLESLGNIPIENNYAEVVFNSFVIEHISKEATNNLVKEAYRMLKPGGVFHSKVHCYEYAYRLLNKGIIPLKFPYELRETNDLIKEFIKQEKGKVDIFYNNSKELIIQSKRNSDKKYCFTYEDAFIYHNLGAGIYNFRQQKAIGKNNLILDKDESLESFFKRIRQEYIDIERAEPHQHNSDYYSKEELFEFIKRIGFREVYFTQPYQSVSPVLWEKKLNPIHYGFTFSIEAIK